jgi:hypothetical protein
MLSRTALNTSTRLLAALPPEKTTMPFGLLLLILESGVGTVVDDEKNEGKGMRKGQDRK